MFLLAFDVLVHVRVCHAASVVEKIQLNLIHCVAPDLIIAVKQNICGSNIVMYSAKD